MSSESALLSYPVSLPEHELLTAVQIKSGIRVLNLGTGADFRSLELAQRLGPDSIIHGLVPHETHLRTSHETAGRLQLSNIEMFKGTPDHLPFGDRSFDLILFHCSIRDMKYFYETLAEVSRVARSSSQFLLCMMMKDALKEYFSIIEEVLHEYKLSKEVRDLHALKKSRLRSLQESEFVLRHLGLGISEIKLRQYTLTFLDGRSFLNHQFAREELIPDWKLFLNGSNRQEFSIRLESFFNEKASATGSLTIQIPFAVMDCSPKAGM